jgi:hypothetical protein
MLNSSTTVDAGVCGVVVILRGRPGFLFIDPVAAGVLVVVVGIAIVDEGVSFFGCPLLLFIVPPEVPAAVVPGVFFVLTAGVDGVPVPCCTTCTTSSSSTRLFSGRCSGYFT